MKTLLVVDDHESNRQLILSLLRNSSNWHCLEAENGKKALEICLSEKIDLIITDIDMPIMKGTTFIKELRKHHEVDIPVIFYTAADYIPDATLLCKTYGVPLVLVKPCDIEVLQSALKTAMAYIEKDKAKDKDTLTKNATLNVYVSDLENLKIAIDALAAKSHMLAKENLQVLLKVLYNPKKSKKKIPEKLT